MAKIEIHRSVYGRNICGNPPKGRKPLKDKETGAVEEQHAKERMAVSGGKAEQQNNSNQQGKESCIHEAIIE